MKTRSTAFALLATALLGTAAARAQQVAPPAPPPFMDALAQHGTWRNEPNVGWYWRPYEADRTSGWRPYLSGGRWEWIVDAWHWTSDYVWGATVFHYGRWANLADKGGWVWVPGDAFSPAWVHWVKSGDGYWGWAPLPPSPGFAPGFLLAPQLQASDFLFVAEGQLARRNLESVTLAGGPPAVPAAPPAVVQPQPVVVQQQPVVVQQPPYYTTTTPIVIREETRYVGPSIWWDYSVCRYCGHRHGGDCRGYRDSRYSHDHGHRDDYRGRVPDSPRIVPVPTRPPTHVPAAVHQSRNVRIVPAQSVTPAPRTVPNAPIGRQPAPSSTPSSRASAIKEALEGRR